MKPSFFQNLNENGNRIIGSAFWHGRASWHEDRRRERRLEWCFGKHARSAHLKVSTCAGESDDGLKFMFGIPWLFDFYLTLEGVFQTGKERDWGIAIHNGAFWLYPGNWANESNSKDPWWLHSHAYYFPWNYDWYSTEILTLQSPSIARSVFMEKRGSRGKDVFEGMRLKDEVAEQHQATYDYSYTKKNGDVQRRKATVHVTRMVWRMKWWPLTPFQKSRTSIDVKFDQEVGEGEGSYKGGCVGCGYDMLDNETPWECLRRMERERVFKR